MNTVTYNITEDIEFVKSILPEHYVVKESRSKGSIHCKSDIGIRRDPYYNSSGNKITDADDDNRWELIFKVIKTHFGNRFSEVFHNTCHNHVDFTIHIKPVTHDR